jgi:2-hydroxy-3-oxopropionate reductase
MEKIGFIGLGIMGRPMALNIVKAGYAMAVYARRPEAMQPLLDVKAIACSSPQEVAKNSDIIITMVADSPDVEQVILGAQGIIHTAKPGSLVIDMSSISALITREIATKLAAKNINMLDAPVSGGEQGAINAQLSIMVGGSSEQFNRAKTLLMTMGSNVVHVGDNGAGQIAKTCNQVLVSQMIAAVAESLLLAQAAGVDAAKVRQALLGGFAGSKILELHGQKMLARQFAPGFKTKLHHKDLNIAQQIASNLGLALPGLALSSQYLNALMGNEHGELDSSAILLSLENLNGITLSASDPLPADKHLMKT